MSIMLLRSTFFELLLVLLQITGVPLVSAFENKREHDLMMTYNENAIPRNPKAHGNNTNETLIVDVNVFLYSFSSISVVDMDYTIDFLLRQRWLDERLLVIAPKPGEKPNPITYMKSQLWAPDLFFRNAKYGFLHKMTQPNYLIWLDDRGVITFSQKLSLKVSCHMTLWNFPMDTQLCKVNIGSYGYAKEDLEFRWWINPEYNAIEGPETNFSTRNAIFMRDGLEINEFSLVSYDAYYCAASYSSTGAFSCLEIQFRLRRRFGFYLIYTYLPSMLVVVIAWVSFLLDPSSVPGRVSLGLLCVLALITQSAAILTQLPRVSYVKAMDIWVFVCLAFVVSVLLEFAASNTLFRRAVQRNARIARANTSKDPSKSLTVLSDLKGLDDLLQANDLTVVNRNGEIQMLDSLNEKIFEETGDNGTQKDELQCPPGTFANTITAIPIPEKAVKSNGIWRCMFHCCNKEGRCDGPTCQTHRLDLAFALGYPILFAIFNLIYWAYYLMYTE